LVTVKWVEGEKIIAQADMTIETARLMLPRIKDRCDCGEKNRNISRD